MEKLNYLIELASFLKKNDILVELNYIKNRLNSTETELVLPIVGEFSSGKTTFINALTSGKKLETASKPTTSVIYEIYFSNNEEKAEIIFNDNVIKVVNDISSIKNDNLEDVKLIKIYDKSKKIDSKTILVDTPGLSSNNPKHIEALTNYLPNADAIFLLSDVNQQITNSILDFIETNNLVHLPVYLVLTWSDTKTNIEIEDIKQYISNNIKLSIDNIISVSSKNNDLEEFYQLMIKIQEDKNKIINKTLNYRLEKIGNFIKEYLENLIVNINYESNFQEEIKKEKRKLDKIIKAIENLVDDTRNNIDEIQYNSCKDFENHVSSKLNSLISKKSENIDNEAIGIINGTANLVFANYQNEIKRIIYFTASERKNTELLSLRSIESLDFSGFNMGHLNYGMNLSEAGQDSVKGIITGIKIAAVIAATIVTASAGAAPIIAEGTAVTVGSAAAKNATILGKIGTIKKTSDTINGVMNTQTNMNLASKILEKSKNAGKYVQEFKGHLKTYEDYNNQAGQIIKPNQKLGLMEEVVSHATDGVIGKPERSRMINKFLRESLIPEFKEKLMIISNNLLDDIQSTLNQEANISINQIEKHLTELEVLSKNEKKDFEAYMKTLKHYLENLS